MTDSQDISKGMKHMCSSGTPNAKLRLRGGCQKLVVVSAHGRADGTCGCVDGRWCDACLQGMTTRTRFARGESLGKYTRTSLLCMPCTRTGNADVPVSRTRVAQRAMWLGFVFLLPLLSSPLALLLTPFREIVWYRLLALSFGYSGAAFIKWAQWASVRPDMFPQVLPPRILLLSCANMYSCRPQARAIPRLAHSTHRTLKRACARVGLLRRDVESA